MNTVENNLVIEVEYTLTTEGGEVLDSSKEGGALEYIHGTKSIMAQLEEGLTGKKLGEALKVMIEPKDAYGEIDSNLIQTVNKEQFGENANDLAPGMQFEIDGGNGNASVVTVIEVREDDILLDGNHPLAGETLCFDVKVISIRKPTQEELEQGLKQKESSCCDDKGCC